MTNADKVKPEVEIQLGDKTFQMVLSTEAFCLLEKETGKNSFDPKTWNEMNVSTLTLLVWAGLQAHHPDVKLDYVRKNFKLSQTQEIMLLVQKAFENATPTAEKKS
jgi:hypothetical protein